MIFHTSESKLKTCFLKFWIRYTSFPEKRYSNQIGLCPPVGRVCTPYCNSISRTLQWSTEFHITKIQKSDESKGYELVQQSIPRVEKWNKSLPPYSLSFSPFIYTFLSHDLCSRWQLWNKAWLCHGGRLFQHGSGFFDCVSLFLHTHFCLMVFAAGGSCGIKHDIVMVADYFSIDQDSLIVSPSLLYNHYIKYILYIRYMII